MLYCLLALVIIEVTLADLNDFVDVNENRLHPGRHRRPAEIVGNGILLLLYFTEFTELFWTSLYFKYFTEFYLTEFRNFYRDNTSYDQGQI
jgi:hypothetical protein